MHVTARVAGKVLVHQNVCCHFAQSRHEEKDTGPGDDVGDRQASRPAAKQADARADDEAGAHGASVVNMKTCRRFRALFSSFLVDCTPEVVPVAGAVSVRFVAEAVILGGVGKWIVEKG
jgi:hypothetical protein